MCYTPLKKLLDFKLKRAGAKWERQQQARLAKNVNNGESPLLGREYRALLAAENVKENVCLDDPYVVPRARAMEAST